MQIHPNFRVIFRLWAKVDSIGPKHLGTPTYVRETKNLSAARRPINEMTKRPDSKWRRIIHFQLSNLINW